MRLEDLDDDPCPWCEREVDRTGPHGNARVYCSPDCRDAHDSHLCKQIVLDAKRDRAPCLTCGSPIPPADRADKKYCSEACRPRNYPGICETCGQAFNGSNPGQRFCGQSCRGAAVRKHHDRPCQDCGQTFTPRRESSRFCSQLCMRRSRRKTMGEQVGG